MIIGIIIALVLSSGSFALSAWMYDLYMRHVKPFDASFYIFFLVVGILILVLCAVGIVVAILSKQQAKKDKIKKEEALANGKIYLTARILGA